MGATSFKKAITTQGAIFGVVAALLFSLHEKTALPDASPPAASDVEGLPSPDVTLWKGPPLHDLDTDLEAILERGELDGACDHLTRESTRRERLLCGKWMFFYETFGTAGVPAALVQHLSRFYPKSLGPAMSKLGMVPDPTATTPMPIGLATTHAIKGSIPALAFTCASCHFARLRDGRYAVGAPNHHYAYGQQILALTLYTFTAAVPMPGAPRLTPEAKNALAPIVAERRSSVMTELAFGKLLATVGISAILHDVPIPPMPEHVQRHYADWRTGTMDFLIDPLPANDHVHTVSKVAALFSLPTDEERRRAGMPSALLGFAGVAPSVESFLHGFIAYGMGDTRAWTSERLAPLVEYIHSLRAPRPMAPPSKLSAAFGRALFVSKGCATCHDGPHGESTRLFTFDEIGTDRALERWRDPDLTGRTDPSLPPTPDQPPTHKLKAPRLTGTWTMSRFLHNGSLSSLTELFCLTPRPAATSPFGADGHDFTCDGLTDEEKLALIDYLESL